MMSSDNYVIYEIGVKEKHPTKLKDILQKKNVRPMKLASNSGIANNIISNLISGIQTNLHLDNAKKICNVLDCTLDEAFGDGRVDFKTKLITHIDAHVKTLDERDAEGRLWWSIFKGVIDNIK